jgi:peptidyl-prolyl cis-trans isomerase A (cyclophilin A)
MAGLTVVAGAQSTPSAPSQPASPLSPQVHTQSSPPAAPDNSQLPDSPGSGIPQKVTIEPTGPIAIFDTSMGRMTCRLFDKQSPLAAANFVGVATGTKAWTDPVTGQKVEGKPFYDGTTFHRVIPGFMIQGGDRKGDGSGDAGYYFDNENTPGLDFSVAGRLAMANAGANTNGTQFFITEVPYPDLDGKYTIFGQCDSHTTLMVATITRVERDSSDKPLTPVTLNHVTIVREGDAFPPVPATAPVAAQPALPVATMPPPK